MAVPTILSNSSPGAPALSGSTGALRAVLKWALPQLQSGGWTEEFDDAANNVVAFRNQTAGLGTGKFFRFNDDPSNHGGDARRCEVSGFNSMSDIDTGTGYFGADPSYWVKSGAANSTAVPYFIIGDGRTAWMLTKVVSGDAYHWWYLGDYAPLDSTDSGASICSGSSVIGTANTTTVTPWEFLRSAASIATDLYGALGTDGSANNPRHTLLTAGPADGTNSVSIDGSTGASASLIGTIFTTPALVYAGLTSQSITPQLRGLLRGYITFLHDMSGKHSTGDIVTFDTPLGLRECFFVEGASNLSSTNVSNRRHFAIDIGDWSDWDAIL